MRRNPLYAFRNRDAVGIFDVPLNSTIHILDKGDGIPVFVEIISKHSLSAGATIGQFLDDETLYINLSAQEAIPSELERMVEDSKEGWRLFEAIPENHGNIGSHGIDISESTSVSETRGATGDNSLAGGKNTEASGEASTALGLGSVATALGGTVVGRYNDTEVPAGYQSDKILAVGIGSEEYDRKDGLVVYADGVVKAPGLDFLEIVNGSLDTLVTKEYSDDVDGGDI